MLHSLRGLRRDLRWRLTTLIVCAHYALGFGLQSPSAFTMQQVAHSEMATPYRRRVLMSWVYRLDLYLTHGRGYSFRHRALTPEQALTIVVAFLSVLVAVVLTRRLIEHILGAGTPLRWCSLLVVYMLSCHEMLIYDVQARFAYDMPAVAFFAAGFYAAYTRNRPLFYTVLIVGTFNRETTMFLPLLLFLMELDPDTTLMPALRMVKPMRYLELVGQLALWEGLVLLCEHLTGGRGSGVVVPLGDNLRMLANPLHWPVYCSVFGFLWLPLLQFRRFLGNVPLERCSLVLPLWFAIVIVVGDPLELRLENELTPYVAVCVALVLAHSLRPRQAAAPGEKAIGNVAGPMEPRPIASTAASLLGGSLGRVFRLRREVAYPMRNLATWLYLRFRYSHFRAAMACRVRLCERVPHHSKAGNRRTPVATAERMQARLNLSSLERFR